jgi:hypothetical protein
MSSTLNRGRDSAPEMMSSIGRISSTTSWRSNAWSRSRITGATDANGSDVLTTKDGYGVTPAVLTMTARSPMFHTVSPFAEEGLVHRHTLERMAPRSPVDEGAGGNQGQLARSGRIAFRIAAPAAPAADTAAASEEPRRRRRRPRCWRQCQAPAPRSRSPQKAARA